MAAPTPWLPRQARPVYVAGDDPATGQAIGPDGEPITIGSFGGQQRYLGKDSWTWLLVVADSTVSNKATPTGQRRHYRMQLELRREGGRWLTSNLEFVG
jgi:hypothetical protein